MNRILLMTPGFLLLATFVCAGGPPDAPPARAIPGITAPDMNPEACVSCHIDMPERGLDARLSTAAKRWTEGAEPRLMSKVGGTVEGDQPLSGKHPAVAGSENSIPGACIACHDSTASAPTGLTDRRSHV